MFCEVRKQLRIPKVSHWILLGEQVASCIAEEKNAVTTVNKIETNSNGGKD